jgi:zinc/manganese transport system permease protein
MRRKLAAITGISAIILSIGWFLIPVTTPLSSRGGISALLLLPFLACVILIGIHTYFGIHVISRGIIFVDLSLAQIASLGAVIAFALGAALHTKEAYFYSLALALVGAVIFAMSRSRGERIPQEAVIGIVYAVAAAFAMLLVDKNPEGMEIIKGSLTGGILWVDADSIVSTSRIYALVAVLLVIFHERFLLVTRDAQRARREGMRIHRWDLLFYVSFAVVITKSVEISGILLVFSFLVIPAVISTLFLEGLRGRLILGWIVGTVSSLLGLILSYSYDLSAGPTIVSLLTLALVAAGMIKTIRQADKKATAILRVAVGTAGLLIVVGGLYLFGTSYQGSKGFHLSHNDMTEGEIHEGAGEDASRHPPGTRAIHLLDHYAVEPQNEQLRKELSDRIGELIDLLEEDSPETRERAAVAIGEIGDGPIVVRSLEKAFSEEEDQWVRYEIARSLYHLDPERGEKTLEMLLVDEETPEFLKYQISVILDTGR